MSKEQDKLQERARKGGIARAETLGAQERKEIAGKGGRSRAKDLSAEERKEIASSGGKARQRAGKKK